MTITTVDPGTRTAEVTQGLLTAMNFLAGNPDLPLGNLYGALHYEVKTGSPEQDAAEVKRIAAILGSAPHQSAGGQYIADRDFGGGVWYVAVAQLGNLRPLATVPAQSGAAA